MLVAALPALVPLGLLLRFGVDYPYQDDWHPYIAGLFLKAREGRLALGDFFALHNEHRIVIPRVIFFVLGEMTHWNHFAPMIVSWMVLCASSLGILYLIIRTAPPETPTMGLRNALLWFLANLMLFTPLAYENWLWGIGLVNTLPVFFLIAGLIVANSRRLNFWTRAMLALLTCAAATYTAGGGMLTWPLILGVLAWSESLEEFEAKILPLLTFIVGAAVLIGLYQIGYNKPAAAPGAGKTEPPTAGAVQTIEYGIVFLGAEFQYTQGADRVISAEAAAPVLLVLLLAAMGCFIYFWVIRERELCRRMVVWLALAGFALLCAAAAAWFRAPLGFVQALSPRYIGFSICLPLALLNLTPLICEYFRRSLSVVAQGMAAQLPTALASVFLTLHSLVFLPGFRGCAWSEVDCRQWKAAVMLATVAPPDSPLARFAASQYDTTMKEIVALNAMGYLRPPLVASNDATQFQDPRDATASEPIILGWIEQLRPEGSYIIASGFALDPRANKPGDGFFLTYEDEQKRQIIISVGARVGERPEIADKFGRWACRFSGWAASFPVARIPAYMQQVKITAWVLDSDTGKAFKLAGERYINR
jgi:hypothetical protein